MSAPNTVAELQALALQHPALDAPPATVAGWYERKAVVLGHLAGEGNPHVGALAETARAHARAVREGRWFVAGG